MSALEESVQKAYVTAERSVILNVALDAEVAEQLPAVVVETVNDLLKGRYAAVIRRSPVFIDATGDATDMVDWINQRLATLDQDAATDFLVLATGIACLNAFVQVNWTGPMLDLTLAQLFTADKPAQTDLQKKMHATCLQTLSVDSAEVYHLTGELGFLAAARTLLLSEPLRKQTHTASFWAARAVFIQQQLLDDPTGTLQELLVSLAAETKQRLDLANDASSDDTVQAALRVRYELEKALVFSYFGQDKEAFEKMKDAQAASGFEWSLTGALGRRTKFQQFDVSQLVVLAESKKSDKKQDANAKSDDDDNDDPRPETLDLNDDTLLEKISFTQTDENDQNKERRVGNLSVIDQCLLLAFCLNVKNTNPDHGITTEEMKPYVARVLENCNNWMVHTMALLLRTRLEAHKSRTVERSALQLQALVDQVKVEDSGVEERLAYFYDLLLPSKWEMERELAGRFMSLGVVRSALEIFERLEMWEDVVSCYQMLEQPEKAKQVLQRLMEQDPNSPKLWCILGDVEKNPDHWRKAWEISNHRFARAMRSLGSYLYRQNDMQGCIECYQKALEINPLFEGSWYVLGCAAIQAEEWEIGARAFRRVVSLDNEQAEGWNNLASIYVQMDRKPDAFLALQQATKLKFDNWKMWQNLMIIAVDVGQFPDAIWAMQRVVELRWDKARERAVDIQVLQVIVENVIQNWEDPHQREGRRLSGQVQRLLEEVILSRITNSPDIWRICSKFYLWQQRYTDALEATVKGYRAVMHDPRIETEIGVFEDVATVALETVDMYETLGDKEQDGAPVCSDWRYQSRQIIKGLLGKVRDIFEDTEPYDRLKERLEDLKRS